MALETKDRILDAAERLFADHGYAATSLRDITSEAGVNLASVNYHFGSKEALLGAVVKRRLGPVNHRRMELLDGAEARAGDRPPDLREIIRAVIVPPFETRKQWGAAGTKFLKLVGRIHAEADDSLRATFFAQFDNVFARFAGLAQRALPDLELLELRRRIQCLTGAMAYVMCWSDSFAAVDSATPFDPDRMLDTLIEFGAAGLSAPVAVEREGAR